MQPDLFTHKIVPNLKSLTHPSVTFLPCLHIEVSCFSSLAPMLASSVSKMLCFSSLCASRLVSCSSPLKLLSHLSYTLRCLLSHIFTHQDILFAPPPPPISLHSDASSQSVRLLISAHIRVLHLLSHACHICVHIKVSHFSSLSNIDF